LQITSSRINKGKPSNVTLAFSLQENATSAGHLIHCQELPSHYMIKIYSNVAQSELASSFAIEAVDKSKQGDLGQLIYLDVQFCHLLVLTNPNCSSR
jgi:hypothetical protein